MPAGLADPERETQVRWTGTPLRLRVLCLQLDLFYGVSAWPTHLQPPALSLDQVLEPSPNPNAIAAQSSRKLPELQAPGHTFIPLADHDAAAAKCIRLLDRQSSRPRSILSQPTPRQQPSPQPTNPQITSLQPPSLQLRPILPQPTNQRRILPRRTLTDPQPTSPPINLTTTYTCPANRCEQRTTGISIAYKMALHWRRKHKKLDTTSLVFLYLIVGCPSTMHS
jgi:hypothetical protein